MLLVNKVKYHIFFLFNNKVCTEIALVFGVNFFKFVANYNLLQPKSLV